MINNCLLFILSNIENIKSKKHIMKVIKTLAEINIFEILKL